MLDKRLEVPAYKFANELQPALTTEGLIVASGGHCTDPDGYQVAYDASYMLYWLDRKGWDVCVEDQSTARIQELKNKGAVYFVGEKKYMDAKPSFQNEMRQMFPAVSEGNDFAVFDLTKPL